MPDVNQRVSMRAIERIEPFLPLSQSPDMQARPIGKPGAAFLPLLAPPAFVRAREVQAEPGRLVRDL